MPNAIPDDRRAARRTARAAARLHGVQALFQMEAMGQGLDRVREEFETHRFGLEYELGAVEEADVDLFRALLDAAVDEQARIDQMTDRALVAKWPIDRIDPTLRAVFRAAGGELLTTETPAKVIIVEYVEIARAFFPEGKEGGFVNAVLDHMAREARPEQFAT
jgi:N utilization substance protein B